VKATAVRLPSFWKQENHQNQTFDCEHPEGSVLAVPKPRLPHKEPFGADAKKREEPLKHSGSEGDDSDMLGTLKFCLRAA
jgi:hypothetical protein